MTYTTKVVLLAIITLGGFLIYKKFKPMFPKATCKSCIKFPHSERLKILAKIAKDINNDIRKSFGQEESRVETKTESIEELLIRGLDPETSHNAWRKMIIADGWTGGEYNQEAKTHPSLLLNGYDDLPFCEKVKDYTIWAVINAASKAMDEYEKQIDWAQEICPK